MDKNATINPGSSYWSGPASVKNLAIAVRGSYDAEYFTGKIDDARIYNTALDEETIASLEPNVQSKPMPFAWWDFEDGTLSDRAKTFSEAMLFGKAHIKDGKLCLEKGVGEIIVGDITHIRDNNDKGGKINAIIHNFWSFRYIIERLKTTAENFGIKVKLVRENGTSSRCPWCKSKNVRKHKRLFKCLSCGIEAHRDVVGALNIALLHGEGFNRVLAHPVHILMDMHEPPRPGILVL